MFPVTSPAAALLTSLTPPERELAVVFLWQQTGTAKHHGVIDPISHFLYDCWCVRMRAGSLDVSPFDPAI